MTISIVVPCYNEEQYVGLLLQDIANQAVAPNEVYVVDCNSTDNTLKVAQTWNDTLPLIILKSPFRSAASARNVGATASKSEYVLFLDADVRINQTFLAHLIGKVLEKQVDFVSPRFNAVDHNPFDLLFIGYINAWIHQYHMRLLRRAMGIGGALLIRKQCHDAIGGYISQMREFDDINYCTRLNKIKVSYAFAREAIATPSNRRFVEQGRLYTLLQSLPDNHVVVRQVVRPLMKVLGVKPKWHEHEV